MVTSKQLLLATTLCLGAATCGGSGSGGNKSIEFTLTKPDGTQSSESFSGSTGFLFDGNTRATVSFPDIATWNINVPLGVAFQIAPLQPGIYNTGGSLHLGEDSVAKVKPLTVAARVNRILWQNDGAYPFRMEGSIEATTTDGYKVSGTFSTTTDDCKDKVKSNGNSFLCGLNYPNASYPEQTWNVGNWVTDEGCPAELTKLYGGGATVVINQDSFNAGGQKKLACVDTYTNAYKSICGANEENVQAAGCTWAVTAWGTPGAFPYNEPRIGIYAGATNDACAGKFCMQYGSKFTHVSGAESVPN